MAIWRGALIPTPRPHIHTHMNTYITILLPPPSPFPSHHHSFPSIFPSHHHHHSPPTTITIPFPPPLPLPSPSKITPFGHHRRHPNCPNHLLIVTTTTITIAIAMTPPPPLQSSCCLHPHLTIILLPRHICLVSVILRLGFSVLPALLTAHVCVTVLLSTRFLLPLHQSTVINSSYSKQLLPDVLLQSR